MLDQHLQPRHWSSCQTYATGDVVINMISRGWQVVSAQPAHDQSRAILHMVSLCRDGENIDLLVLDGPAVQDLIMKLTLA